MPPPILDSEEEEEMKNVREEEYVKTTKEDMAACGRNNGKENECSVNASDCARGSMRPPQQKQYHYQQQQYQQQLQGFDTHRRNLLLCCVRLSVEKEPHRFVEIVESMAKSGILYELGVVPALVGGGHSVYAKELRERVLALSGLSLHQNRQIISSVVEDGFVGASELATRFFDRTLLNIHPCLADAYGMSAVEAASRGTPSVIHRRHCCFESMEQMMEEEHHEEQQEQVHQVQEGNVQRERKIQSKDHENTKNGTSCSCSCLTSGKITVGASALLRPEEGESIALDLTLPIETIAGQIADILRAESRPEKRKEGKGRRRRPACACSGTKKTTTLLSDVGKRACERARSWGEREHGEALAEIARRAAHSTSSCH